MSVFLCVCVCVCVCVRARDCQAFNKFDSDGSGVLARDEFTQAMKALGLRATEAEYNKLFDEYDIDKSGEIDLVRTCCMHMNETSHVLACCSLTSLITYINAH